MSCKLGTVAAIGFDDFPPQSWLACFRELGCTVVQAYRNTQLKISLSEMKDAIAAGGMPCDSLHGIFGEEFDPSATLEENRKFAVDTFKSEGELCRNLGGSLVVVHCSTIRRDGISADERLRRLEQLKKSIIELGDFGKIIGVKYAFENLPKYHPLGWDVSELADILNQLNAPSTGMCFDTGHANMTGNVSDAILAAGNQISYVHLNDNSGLSDDHAMINYGTLDSQAVAKSLCQIGYSGTMMLEVFYPVQKLRELIDAGCADRLSKILSIANGGN